VEAGTANPVESTGQQLANPGCAGLEGGRVLALCSTTAHPESSELQLPFFAPDHNPDNWRGVLGPNPHLVPSLEPGFRVLVDGVAVALDADRADQLRAAGNGVVTFQAAVAYGVLFDRLFNTGISQKSR
jgi:hypothetical protein